MSVYQMQQLCILNKVTCSWHSHQRLKRARW